jgi:hypothetical protein
MACTCRTYGSSSDFAIWADYFPFGTQCYAC